jgi:hypothetical protein
MNPCILLAAIVYLALAGCSKAPDASDRFASAHGRYLGVAVYAPGPGWLRIAQPTTSAGTNAAALRDDEQVIVVVDSVTGEVRQCGNLSGFCVAMNPWAVAHPTGAPVPLVRPPTNSTASP